MSYYISPRFLDKLAVHITKNFLDLPNIRVPLILGIHGRKGEGKSFQCELVFQRMGVEVVHMSAGELESPDAGDSSRLVRLRYREAADLIRVRGRMAVLMINDLDAGAGRFDQGTQYTVNTQLVNATLMNIADNPTNVQLPGSYDDKPLHRVPIIVTGNDLSTLYAPLIRDGRMDKFYWEPDRSDKIGTVGGIFELDGLSARDVEELVDTFPTQSIDFFGALRARLYDEQIRNFIYEVGVDRVASRVVNTKEKPPEFRRPDFRLLHLIEVGNLMVQEQQRVQQMRLVREYNESLQVPTSAPPVNLPANGGAQPARPAYNAEAPRESANGAPQPSPGNGYKSKDTRQPTRSNLNSEAIEEVRRILGQGYRLGIEHVDQRRFRTNSWKSYATLTGNNPSEAIANLEACLAEHGDEYIRIVGIDPQAKRRVIETIVQRPTSQAIR